MFGSFRRHQKWIWFLGVLVIIPSFVIFFAPNASWKAAGGASQAYIMNGKAPTINGKPISVEEYRACFAETLLGHFFRAGGKWPEGDEVSKESLEHDTVIRVFMLHKLNDLDIKVSDEAVARLAMERLGTYPLANLEREHLAPHGVTLVDFDRFMRHEAAIQQLVGVVTTSAKLINPKEAEILYRKENEQVGVELAVFWSSNYLDKVTVNPAAVATFYTNHMASYRVPERVQVSYVEFAGTNFLADADKQLADVTNLTARIDDWYYKRGTNTFKDTNGVALSETAAKAKIKEDIRLQSAMVFAHRKASEFGGELMNQAQPERADNLEKLAAAKGLPVKITPPFDRIGGLEDTNFPPDFREKALKLTKENPVVFNPILGEDAIYLIALKNRIPSEMPPLERVQDKVTTDYKNFQAWELARTSGTNFAASVTNGLAAKKSFDQICEQAKVKPTVLPPFSPSTSLTNLDERLSYMVHHLAFSLKPGEASQFYPMQKQEGGLVVYVKEKLPLDETKMKADLPEFVSRLRMYRQNEDFNQWFTKQAELAKLFIPRKESSISPGAMN
jgi:hypothetical protein